MLRGWTDGRASKRTCPCACSRRMNWLHKAASSACWCCWMTFRTEQYLLLQIWIARRHSCKQWDLCNWIYLLKYGPVDKSRHYSNKVCLDLEAVFPACRLPLNGNRPSDFWVWGSSVLYNWWVLLLVACNASTILGSRQLLEFVLLRIRWRGKWMVGGDWLISAFRSWWVVSGMEGWYWFSTHRNSRHIFSTFSFHTYNLPLKGSVIFALGCPLCLGVVFIITGLYWWVVKWPDHGQSGLEMEPWLTDVL